MSAFANRAAPSAPQYRIESADHMATIENGGDVEFRAIYLCRLGNAWVCLPPRTLETKKRRAAVDVNTLASRRQLLENLLAARKDPLRLSQLLDAPSDQILEAVRKLGLEGVVGKRIDSLYEPGERSGAWIKLRANMEQEFVIGRLHPWSTRIRCLARRRL